MAAVAFVAAMSAAGCTASHVGTASPQPMSSTTIGGGDRPRELKIDGLKACELLTEAQRVELVITRPPHHREDPIFESDACNFNNHTASTTLSLYVMTRRDMRSFSPGEANGVVRSVRVLGFSGFQVHPEEYVPLSPHCSVNIGVSEGQVLRAGYSTLGEEHALPQDEVCRRATRGLEMALGNILAKG
ncbi:DUF3558 domain-containing protein [Allokutzneria multivorans]